MIQAESQLESAYGSDGKTIIGNCDTYVYLGGNDVQTAKAVAERCDVPAKKILNMPIGRNWIFSRGQAPEYGENYDLDDMLTRIDHYGRLMYLKKHSRILPGERTFFEVVECDDLAFRMDLFHNSFKQGAFSCLSCAGYQDGGVLFMTALILKAPQ